MEIRTIRYFLTVVDTGSISAASRALHVAQPSLSRRIRQLETSLGSELFVRHRRRLHISPAGARLLPVARDPVTRHDQAVTMMRALAEGREPRLTVACTVVVAASVKIRAIEPVRALTARPGTDSSSSRRTEC
ncbi:LysR family transcriptional regulator [Streptomyces decoyicus]|uniref:LysR family transcriptional regulator n=1 Tax=Streptomyces decoyicus TaxID=249567 RepID=UPI003811375E